MDDMYYGESSRKDVGFDYEPEEEFGRNDRDWRRDRRHRSRSPLDRGSSRKERSRSRERNPFSDRRSSNSPSRSSERDSHRRRNERLLPTSIEYHHGLPEQRTRLAPPEPRVSRSDRWLKEMPSSTIFLGGLQRFIDEQDIRAELNESGVVYSDVRMVRNKDTGANRGFAFVEFHSIDDARRWMDLNQGLLNVRDSHGVSHTVTMDYSKASNPVQSPRLPAPALMGLRQTPPGMRQSRPPEITEWRINDWKCHRCGCDNFRRRENCFQCNIPRSEGERVTQRDDDGYDQVGSNPCNTLLLRGLDALTTEPSIINSLATVCDMKPKNVFVVRNSLTGLSRGYAVVECSSIRESAMLLDTINNSGSSFEVDGKAIIVSFCKNTYSTFMAYLGQQSSGSHTSRYEDQQQDNGMYSSHGAAHNSGLSANRRAVDPTNAAQVAEAALLASRQQQQQLQENGEISAVDTNQSISHTNVVTPPDVNTFIFDDTSGYYYDSNTGYYYDANTQYFYNPQSSQFLYWDSSAQSYLPAPANTEATGNNSSSSNIYDSAGDSSASGVATSSAAEQVVEQEKLEKAKQAKKIAKDMERWAKVQNSQKESTGGFKKPIGPVPVTAKKESATADAGFLAISKVTKSDKFTIEIMKNREDRRPFGKVVDDSKSKAAQLVASYGGDSESDDEVEEPAPQPQPPLPSYGGTMEDLNLTAIEAKMTDFDKMTCLLCKRLFNTREALLRHQQLSDLHKSNLQELKKSLTASKGR